jgi:hypothetical protein
MVPDEFAAQLRSEVQRLKEAQEAFLKTFQRLCEYHGGPTGLRKKSEMVFTRVRGDIIPVMNELGMDQESVQAMCAWAEHVIVQR